MLLPSGAGALVLVLPLLLVLQTSTQLLDDERLACRGSSRAG